MDTQASIPTPSFEASDFNHLRLRVGEILQLQIEGEQGRYHVRLVGYLEDRSIIVTIPILKKRLVPVRTGQGVNVRMMVNDRACAFSTAVLHSYRLPYPHMHLEYPSDLVTNSIRKAVRVEIRVDGTVLNASIGDRAQEINCYLQDISITGAHLVTPLRIGKSGDEISLTLKFKIGEMVRKLKVAAILRGRLKVKASSEQKEIHYGVEFLDVSDDDRVELIAFVYSKLSTM